MKVSALIGMATCLSATFALPSPAEAATPKQKRLPVTATPTGEPGQWVRDDDYPTAAMADGIEGISGFRLDINTEGRPTACTITTSSGSDVLDEATCNLLVARARFTTARDRKGRPVPDTFTSRIVWRIPKEITVHVTAVPERLSFEIDVDEEGAVEDCRVIDNSVTTASGYNGPKDPCEAVRRSKTLIPVLDASGNPVRATITRKMESTIRVR